MSILKYRFRFLKPEQIGWMRIRTIPLARPHDPGVNQMGAVQALKLVHGNP